MTRKDHELEFLLELHSSEFRFESGYKIKIEALVVKVATGRPSGVKYSLTLHDVNGRRIYGLDNAHPVVGKGAYDHRHVYGSGKVVPYMYKGAAQLLEDFYREVERIMKERGVQ